MRGTSNKQPLHAQTKASSYEAMRKSLSNADTEPDHALAAMMMAATTDEENSAIHLRGLDQLMRARGGHTAFGKTFIHMHPDFFIMTYSFKPFVITTFQDFESCKTNFIKTLAAMSARHTWLCAEKTQAEVKRVGTDGWQPIDNYYRSLDDLIQCDCAGKILCIPYDPTLPYIRRARHFAMLFNLHRVLLSFPEIHFTQQIIFLQKLRQISKDSSARDAESGAWLLRAGALVSLICHARSYVMRHSLGEQEASRIGSITSCSTIEALKVFSYISPQDQEMVVGLLRSWLLDKTSSSVAADLDGSRFDELSSAMTEMWLHRQTYS